MHPAKLWATLIGFGLGAASLCSHAGNRAELLFFPNVIAAHRSGLPEGDELKTNQTAPALDMLAIGSHGSLSWLAEIFVAEREHELARLHAGWRSGPDTLLSVGKFHNLQGYWNTQFHHGAFLQTSIDRPGVVEDDSPLPTHYVGMQLEGRLSHWGEGTIDYSLGVGKGPVLKEMLESPDIIGPGRLGGLTAGLRFAYTLDETAPTQVGIFFARNKIPVENGGWNGLTQNIGGLFGNWEYEQFRVIGEIYAFDSTLNGTNTPASGSFLNAYLQGEYRLVPSMTAYARAEDTRGGGDDPMLALFPEFAQGRGMLGLRYDITRNQALKVEVSRVRRLDDNFSQLQIQWSAVLP